MPLNKEMITKRNGLIKKFGFKLIKVFDTNEHEDYKDVVLVYDSKDKLKKVLRIGEHRTKNFLYNGYKGKYLIIPKIYQINTSKDNKYEIEEYIEGEMIIKYLDNPLANKILPDKYINRLIKSFWEFQEIAKKVKLPRYEVLDQKIKKHLNYAIKLMDNPNKVVKLLNTEKVRSFFQDNNYPCKWKFSVDNLIVTPKNKLAFIDLAKVGKRFWGYDLGWIFWPIWFCLPIEEYESANDHLKYLERLFKKVEKTASKGNKIDIIYSGYLIILERVIGTLYDLAADISHARKINKMKNKRKAFIKFLNGLLNLIVNKIIS